MLDCLLLTQVFCTRSTACIGLLLFRSVVALFILWIVRAMFMRNFVQACCGELFLAMRKALWVPWNAGECWRRDGANQSNEQPTNHPVYGRAYSSAPEYTGASKYYYEKYGKYGKDQHPDWLGHGYWQHGELRWEVG